MPKIRKLSAGMTLVEILLVMSILLLMIGVMTGTLNPIALINKAKDARRKKDISRIKVAMEEYVADEGCYPVDSLLTELVSEIDCGTDVFSPWLNSWPCDPNGSPYHLFVEEVDCPAWFKVIVNLENEKDRDIPSWWYDNSPGSYLVGDGSLSNAEVNFGVSSTNVLWYERAYSEYCLSFGQCYSKESGGCDDAGGSCVEGGGTYCFLDPSCELECQVSCCSGGHPCD